MGAGEPVVFIVDDDDAMRDALALLMLQVGLAAECYASAQAFLEAYQPGRPGCLLVDVRMPGMSGLELQQRLASEQAPLPVIVISGHGDVPIAVRAMKAGAADFIEKPFNDQDLLDRVRDCMASAARAHRQQQARAEASARLGQLSPREREVMDMIADGAPSKSIAARLNISPKTVNVHRANIFAKLRVRSVAELVRIALTAEQRPRG